MRTSYAKTWHIGAWVIMAASLFILAAAFSSFLVDDPDVPQYLASGREILRHGFQKTCVFNYSSDQCQIVYAEWLFQMLTYGVYRLAGWAGLSVLQVICAALLYGLLFLYGITKKISPWILLPVLFASIFVARERFLARADTLMLLLAAGLYWLVQELKTRLQQGRPITWVAAGALLVQLLWTNIHGSFPLGWFIVGSFAGEALVKNMVQRYWRRKFTILLTREVKLLFAILAGVILVSFINPYGWDAFIKPFTFYFGQSQFNNQVAEFVSPFAASDYPRQSVQVFAWLLGIVGALAALNIKRVRLAHVLILVLFAYFGVTHIRFIALFAVFFVLIVPEYLAVVCTRVQAWLITHTPRGRYYAVACMGAVVLCMAGIGTKTVYALVENRDQQTTRVFGFGMSELAYPRGAASFVQAHRIPGNMFNDYTSGGYLNWVLYPETKTFVDGHTYTLALVQNYGGIMAGTIPFLDAVTMYHIDYVVLDHQHADTTTLIGKLYNDPAWALVFVDENSLVFVQRTKAYQALIDAYEVNFAHGRNVYLDHLISVRNPAAVSRAWLYRGSLLANLHLPAQAVAQYQKAVDADPGNYIAFTHLGIAESQLGHIEEAFVAYAKAEGLDSNYAPLQYNLGAWYANAGDVVRATAAFKRALRINPSLQVARWGLEAIGRAADTVSSVSSVGILEEKVSQNTEDPDAHVQLGVAYGLKGEYTKAVEEYTIAISLLAPDDPRIPKIQQVISMISERRK